MQPQYIRIQLKSLKRKNLNSLQAMSSNQKINTSKGGYLSL